MTFSLPSRPYKAQMLPCNLHLEQVTYKSVSQEALMTVWRTLQNNSNPETMKINWTNKTKKGL